MTRRLRFTLTALVLLVPAAAHPSDYSDFRIPSHSWSRLELAFAGEYSPSFTSDDTRQDRRTDAQGALGGSWLHGHDSERLEHTLEIAAGVTGVNSRRELDIDQLVPYLWKVRDDSQNRFATETWNLFGEIRHYPWATPLGLTARLTAQGNYGQEWDSEDRSEEPSALGPSSVGITQSTNES
jgi:hypothetical protein